MSRPGSSRFSRSSARIRARSSVVNPGRAAARPASTLTSAHPLKETSSHRSRGGSPVESLRDVTAALKAADPADNAATYAGLGTSVTYHQDRHVNTQARPRVVTDGVG